MTRYNKLKTIMVFLMTVFICIYLIELPAHSAIITKPIVFKSPVDEQVTDLDLLLLRVVLMFQGRITFGSGNDGSNGENMKGQYQVYTTNGSADTEDTLAHTLPYIPSQFIVTSVNKGGVLYKGSTAWDGSNVYFKCTTTSTTVTVFIW